MPDDAVPFFARREASELSHTGPIVSPVGGRTDHLPITVPANSYVLPSDVVSGLPGAEGNSTAGHRILSRLFSQGPYGTTLPHRAAGGQVGGSQGVPIMAAGGEYVIPPEHVAVIGGGDVKHGHKVLDHMVSDIRKKNIATLRKLPGPAKK